MPFKSIADEMHRFKQGSLHSGSPGGPVVKNRKQAIAISLSEARKKGQKTSPAPHRRPGGATRGHALAQALPRGGGQHRGSGRAAARPPMGPMPGMGGGFGGFR